MEMIENTIWYRGRVGTILVDGVELPVETDHRAVLLFWRLLQDGTLPMVVRTRLFSRLAVSEGAEAVDPARLLTALLAFYGFTTGQGVPGRPHFDLWYDGERIVASFRAAYGIDLLETPLHWHRFLALLRQLPPDTVFMRVVRLRQLDLREIEDDTLRYRLRQAKRAVQLPDTLWKGEYNGTGTYECFAGTDTGGADATERSAGARGDDAVAATGAAADAGASGTGVSDGRDHGCVRAGAGEKRAWQSLCAGAGTTAAE